jgi:putative ABC transport system permease protein
MTASRLRALWRNLRYRDRVERDLDDEMKATLDLLIDEKVAAGVDLREARRLAMIELNRIEPIKERVRDIRAGIRMETVLQDVKYACRHFRRSPAFAAAAVLTLAFGIGANTAMFSVLNALLFKRLPIVDPDGLYSLTSHNDKGLQRYIPVTLIPALEQEGPFEIVCGYNAGGTLPVEANGRPTLALVGFISGRCFDVFGVMPRMGRPIVNADVPLFTAGRKTVVISDRLWHRIFGGDPNVIGKTMKAENNEVTVAGVMAPGFLGIQADTGVDVFAPHDSIIPAQKERRPVASEVLVRLRSGVSFEQATAEITARWPALLEQARASMQQAQEGANIVGATPRLERMATGLSTFRDRYSPTIQLILGLTGLLLLLACVNLGGLLLTRLTARGTELGVRLALGGSQWRIAQQMLTESLVLSISGALLAIPVSYAFILPIASIIPTGYIDRMMSFTPDLRVLASTAAAGIVVGVVVTALPTWFAMRRRASIHFAWDRTIAGSTNRWTRGLAVAQVALSMVLLIGAALLARSLYALQNRDLGVRSDGVVTAKLLPVPGGRRLTNTDGYYPQIIQKLLAEPGVESVALSGLFPRGILTTGQPIAFTGEEFAGLEAHTDVVTPEFFSTLGIPLLEGRLPTWSDNQSSRPVVVVNESLASALGGNVVERRVKVGTLRDSQDLTIIGVVANATRGDPRETADRILFRTMPQARVFTSANVIVRTSASPAAAMAATRRIVQEGGKEYVLQISELDAWFDQVPTGERMSVILATMVGSMAVLLALIGVHGVLAYSVSRRTREIGVRVAVGASPATVARAVVREGVMLTVFGVAIGLPAAYLAARAIRSMLFGVTETDGLTFSAVAVFFVLLGLLAGTLPARRAATVDPVIALRAD